MQNIQSQDRKEDLIGINHLKRELQGLRETMDLKGIENI